MRKEKKSASYHTVLYYTVLYYTFRKLYYPILCYTTLSSYGDQMGATIRIHFSFPYCQSSSAPLIFIPPPSIKYPQNIKIYHKRLGGGNLMVGGEGRGGAPLNLIRDAPIQTPVCYSLYFWNPQNGTSDFGNPPYIIQIQGQ